MTLIYIKTWYIVESSRNVNFLIFLYPPKLENQSNKGERERGKKSKYSFKKDKNIFKN